MTNLDFFKQQADFFLKDYQSRTPYSDERLDYEYHPKFFYDIGDILSSYDIFHKTLSLMKAQHYIAKLAGFRNWSDLKKAPAPLLEIGKLILQNREEYEKQKGSYLCDDWLDYNEFYLKGFDDNKKLEIFKTVFLNTKKLYPTKIFLDFSDDINAQDMLKKIMQKKALSAKDAILSSITKENRALTLKNGWGELVLTLWEYTKPDSEKDRIENPVIELELDTEKESLLLDVIETLKVSSKKAATYYMRFALTSLGYPIFKDVPSRPRRRR